MTQGRTDDVRFRRHGKRNILGLILLIVAFALMCLRAVRKMSEGGYGADDAIIVVTVLLLIAVISGALAFGMGALTRARTARLRASASFAVTMVPLGDFWPDLANAFRRSDDGPHARRRLRPALTFTLTADARGVAFWTGFAQEPERVAWIDWRDVVHLDTADIADRFYRQRGLVLSVAAPEAPTELAMVMYRDALLMRRVREPDSIAAAVRTLEDLRLDALADSGEGR
ncbi:hypothetical protein ACFDTO_19660 [Microbacteriaceae bacterium 4G12]